MCDSIMAMQPTFKQILAMPYGTSHQMDLMDTWYKRFMSFYERNEYMISDKLWTALHNTDIGYQARRRFNFERRKDDY